MQEQTGTQRGEQIVAGVKRLTPFAVGGVKLIAPIAVKAVGARYPKLGVLGRLGLRVLEERTSNGETGGVPDILGQREMGQTQPDNSVPAQDDNGGFPEHIPPPPPAAGKAPVSTGTLEALRALINDGLSGSAGPPHSAALPIDDRRASNIANSTESGRSITRATLSGNYDTAAIGGFTFSLNRSNHDVQLSVSQPGVPGNIGGLFTLEKVPHSTWIQLEGRQDRLLPVWVLVEDMDVKVVVGSGPSNAIRHRPVDRKVGHRLPISDASENPYAGKSEGEMRAEAAVSHMENMRASNVAMAAHYRNLTSQQF